MVGTGPVISNQWGFSHQDRGVAAENRLLTTDYFSPMDKPLSGHKIGFVGLGNMGRAMARHLHAAGAHVVVWNRSDAPAEAAVALGMKRAATLPELAREIGDGVVCLNLTTTDVVEKVAFGEGGLIEGL